MQESWKIFSFVPEMPSTIFPYNMKFIFSSCKIYRITVHYNFFQEIEAPFESWNPQIMRKNLVQLPLRVYFHSTYWEINSNHFLFRSWVNCSNDFYQQKAFALFTLKVRHCIQQCRLKIAALSLFERLKHITLYVIESIYLQRTFRNRSRSFSIKHATDIIKFYCSV